ncbi:hypothetical protein NIES2119_22410 [[Phormidium ambiguum] IAM M-71]|uniref:Uncharacterized protein n=1 Tax=[Phormidium ambiguum] IAM M-71 TaxID=454136 RepID=A0A1U7IAR7_9CYAN|nr:hypothetical protein [Phormidium ambiguum]OKH33680.1 hypothetical protein NIES2119_22410 [Phormidium ambiguum IAM M-71]
MDTFLRLASLGTLIVGLQVVVPESSSATAISNQLRQFSSVEQSTAVSPIYEDYDPPNNGGPTESGQGSGTR